MSERYYREPTDDKNEKRKKERYWRESKTKEPTGIQLQPEPVPLRREEGNKERAEEDKKEIIKEPIKEEKPKKIKRKPKSSPSKTNEVDITELKKKIKDILS